MAFSFRFTFTGMCAFVPRQLGLAEHPQGTVLLVNATNPIDDLNLHAKLEDHTPTIEVHGLKRNLIGYDIRVEFRKANGDLGSTIPSELAILDILPNPKPDQPRPNTDDDRDPFWIMDMAALKVSSLSAKCFDPVPPKALVAARFKLTAGFLSTSRMVEDKNDGTDIPWNFQKSSTATAPLIQKRPIAAEFAVTGIADADKMILILTPFGAAAETIELTPVAGEIVLAVENNCDCSPGPEDGARGIRLISDFGWFYRLLETQPESLHLPYVADGGGLTDTQCPPARYPQNPLA